MRQNKLTTVAVLFLAVLLSLGGCRATKLENACEFVNEGSSQENKNRALGYQVVDAMNRNNTEALDVLMSQNYVCHLPAASVDGLEMFKQSVKNAHRGLAGFNLAVHEIIAEKNMTLARFTTSGKHVGEFLGVPGTGNQIKIAVMIWSKYENDKIVEEWEFPDMIGMLQQVNILMPSHESAIPALHRSFTKEFEWGDNVFTKSDSCNPQANKAIVRKAFNGLWGKGNPEIAYQYISSGLIVHAPNIPDLKNLNDIDRYLANIKKAAKLKVSINEMIGERDLVAVKWSASASSNEKQITLEGIVIFKIYEDKIKEAWLSADIKGLYEQLGLLVNPKS